MAPLRRVLKGATQCFCILVGFTALLTLRASCDQPPDCKTPIDIHTPVYAGTKVLGYEHGTFGCKILIYANGKLVRSGPSDVAFFGSGKVYLERALQKGEVITAKQEPTGFPTWKPPTVEKIPHDSLIQGEKFNPPVIDPPTVDCQAGFNVHGLVEGVRAIHEIKTPGPVSGSDWTPYDHTFLFVLGKLHQGYQLAARQDMETGYPLVSDPSNPPTLVDRLPSTLPQPTLRDILDGTVPNAMVGNPALMVDNLFVGAEVKIFSVDQQKNEEVVLHGVAPAPSAIGRLTKPVEKDHLYCVQQWLCTLPSLRSKCISTVDWLMQPIIREPVCADDTDVTVDWTAPGATVWLRVNGVDNGNATAPDLTTIVPVTGGVALHDGDKLKVRQSNAVHDSGWRMWEATVVPKEVCARWPRPNERQRYPQLEHPTISATMCCTNPKDWKFCPPCKPDGETCKGAGTACKTHPTECSGRPAFEVNGKVECVDGQPVCKATAGQNYCSMCGGDCGGCRGQSCAPTTLCAPPDNCVNGMCVEQGLGCKPIPQFCWTKAEVGHPEIGCQ